MAGTARLGGLVVIALALLLAGCASAGAGGGGAGEVSVVVENNLIPPTSLSIYAVSEATSSRRLVGVVEPSATKTLTFNPVSVAGQYRLVAETTAGREIVSNPITLAADGVRWDVNANIAVPR